MFYSRFQNGCWVYCCQCRPLASNFEERHLLYSPIVTNLNRVRQRCIRGRVHPIPGQAGSVRGRSELGRSTIGARRGEQDDGIRAFTELFGGTVYQIDDLDST